ncbi:MAG: flagellar hook-associated protein FlgK [Aquabacterium sp.]|jgi:flagellar hook-associated protein 1 FlgK
MGTGIFSMGTRAIFAAQTMLDTTSNNISNVNTPGYSRQQVQLSTEDGLFTGAGFFGRGVKVQTITRATNEFLTKEVNRTVAGASADKSRLDKLSQLEKVLPTGETGLGYAAGQVLNAFVDVANQPQDLSARQVVLARAQEWVSRVNSAGQQLNELQSGVVLDLGNTVDRINGLTRQIAQANDAIAKFQGVGHEPNDLLDRRDLLVRQLNELVQVNTVKADDGSLNVFMGGGQVLVLGTDVQKLSMVRDPLDSTLGRVALRDDVNNTDRILDEAQFTGGALSGLLTFQDEDLSITRMQLNSFVRSFAERLNSQQSLGLDANGIPGLPLFDNVETAAGVQLSLSDPKKLAAASPFVVSTDIANRGTVTAGSVRMLPPTTPPTPAPAAPPISVRFFQDTTAASGISYALVDSSNVIQLTQAWEPGVPITDGVSFQLPITGVPVPDTDIGDSVWDGDRLLIQATSNPLSNNGNALAVLALRDEPFVVLDLADTETLSQVLSTNPERAGTLTDSYSQMVGNLGVRVQSGRTSAEISRTLSSNAEQTLNGEVGVNLDEEAARLIQFQQSYQAAAKILQVAQRVFDVLLETAR